MSSNNVESHAQEANKGIHDKDVQANQNVTDFTNVNAKAENEENVTGEYLAQEEEKTLGHNPDLKDDVESLSPNQCHTPDAQELKGNHIKNSNHKSGKTISGMKSDEVNGNQIYGKTKNGFYTTETAEGLDGEKAPLGGNGNVSEQSEFLSSHSTLEDETLLSIALKKPKNKIEEDLANMILDHSKECSRDQICLYLKDPLVMDDLVKGTKFDLEAILLKWNKGPRSNLLHVATELENVALMQEIFRKARNGNEDAEECVETGKVESIQFAAEKLLLEPLNYLLDMDTEPAKTFNKAIGDNEKAQENLEELLHEAAIHDCDKIFTWILASKEKNWLRSCLEKESERGTFFHSIAKGKTKSFQLYEDVLQNLKIKSNEKQYVTNIFAKKDKDENTVLHIAAQEPITDQKLKIISAMLEKGAIPSIRNKNGETFLKMSLGMPQRLCAHINNMNDQWFKHLIRNRKVLEGFIELKNDDIFSTMLKRFGALVNIEKDKEQQVHPITLLHYMWDDRKVFEKSFHELLIWEAKYHENKLDALKECCYEKLKPDKAFVIFDSMEHKVEKPFDFAYCASRAFGSIMSLFFIMKLVDFATDITLNIEYYVDEFQDFPSKSKCDAMTDQTITCYFHQMNGKTLFFTSICMFALTFCFDLYFLMSSKKSNHYLSVLVGFCCWDNFAEATSSTQKALYWLCWVPIFTFNQIFTPLYGFMMDSFVEYWRPSKKERPRMERSKPCKSCFGCTGRLKAPNCKSVRSNEMEKSLNQKSDKIDCICIFCSNNANDSKESQAKLNELRTDSFFVMTLDKVVTSATENSFMPLVQLSIVFPNIIYLFPKEDMKAKVTQTFNTMMNSNLNLTANSSLVDISQNLIASIDISSDIKFTVTAISIITSFISMASTLTLTYFSKPGRNTYQNPKRWFVYFFSIILQVIPKLLAYQVFAFGFIGTYSPGLIIPSLVIYPLLLCLVRALVYYRYITEFRPEHIDASKRTKACLLFGISTVYTFNEQFFYTNEMDNKNKDDGLNNEDDTELTLLNDASNESIEGGNAHTTQSTKVSKRKNLLYCHLVFDSFSLLENFCLAIVGGRSILDENFNLTVFMISLIGMHVLGLIVKASYYLFLHPWESLNTKHALLKRMFMIISGIVALSYSYVIIIACHGSNNVRIFVGIISTIVLSIVMLITGHVWRSN